MEAVPVQPVRDWYLCCAKFLQVPCLRIQRGFVSVRKCHEALRRKGLLESHDSERLLLYGETLLLRLHDMMMIYGVLVKEVKVVLI